MHAASRVGREAQARAPGGLPGLPASDFALAWLSRGERSLVSGPLNIFVLWSFLVVLSSSGFSQLGLTGHDQDRMRQDLQGAGPEGDARQARSTRPASGGLQT